MAGDHRVADIAIKCRFWTPCSLSGYLYFKATQLSLSRRRKIKSLTGQIASDSIREIIELNLVASAVTPAITNCVLAALTKEQGLASKMATRATFADEVSRQSKRNLAQIETNKYIYITEYHKIKIKQAKIVNQKKIYMKVNKFKIKSIKYNEIWVKLKFLC